MEVEAETGGSAGSSSADSAQQDGAYARCPSPAMQALWSLMTELAAADIPVLVVGEAGTGKEVMARQIHQLSSRRDEPFVKLRCAELAPKELAIRTGTDGSTGTPAQGTVLLDEVSELSEACQALLLSFLLHEDRTSDRRRFAVGIVSTTSRDLEEEMRLGRFRSDLYYRVSGVSLRIPPLRQRREDIPVLVSFFLAKYASTLNLPRPALSSRAWYTLETYGWPGNVRELENVVRNLVVLGDEKLALADLERSLGEARKAAGAGNYSLKEAAREASRQAERDLILKVLARTRWNRKRAARELQISYKALLYKLKQMELDDSAA
jgi:two-component system response regulator AtoC